MALLVHPSELEDEVCQTAEVEEDGGDHSERVLSSRPESGHEEDANGDWNSSNCKTVFCVCQSSNDDQELHGKAKEEEEIEFEEGDVNLVLSARKWNILGNTDLECQVTTLHSKIGADVLVYRPRKLIIQLPCNDRHCNRKDPNDARHSNQERLDINPYRSVRSDIGLHAVALARVL